MKSSTAQNYEWEGPYTAWGVDQESDVCNCGCAYCVDCSPSEQIKQGRVRHHESDAAFLDRLDEAEKNPEQYLHWLQAPSGNPGFWLTFYRIKSRIKQVWHR